jgi:hypothetical protein
MPRRRVSRDRNQQPIVDTLRAVGAFVYDAAHIGGGFPDLLVCFRGSVYLLEVKSDNWYGRRGLTARQERFRQALEGFPVSVVHSADDALFVIGALE